MFVPVVYAQSNYEAKDCNALSQELQSKIDTSKLSPRTAELELEIIRSQNDKEMNACWISNLTKLKNYLVEIGDQWGIAFLNLEDPIFKELFSQSGNFDQDFESADAKAWSLFGKSYYQIRQRTLDNIDTSIKRFQDQITSLDEKIAYLQIQIRIANTSPEKTQELKQLQQEAEQTKLKNKENYQARLTQALKEAKLEAAGDASGCSLLPGKFSLTNCFYEGLSIGSGLFPWLSGLIIDFSGYLFNTAIWISIEQFPVYANLSSVNSVWAIVRDVCNLFFIFVLLYIALSTILGDLLPGGGKKLLPKLIIVALLVNFSAVVPKVVIDVSNVFALNFYSGTFADVNGKIDIASTLTANKLDVVNLYYEAGNENVDFNSVYLMEFVSNIGQGILLLITAFVLLAGGFLFLFRTLVLLFLIMTSPLFFLGFAIPGINKYTSQWSSALVGQSLFAPVMMFLLSVTALIANNQDLKNQLIFDSSNAVLGTIFHMLILNGMVLATLVVSSMIAKSSGGFIGEYGNKFKGWGTALVAGGAIGGLAYAGRNVIGRGASRMADNKNLIDRAAKGSVIAKMQLQAARKVAGSSFDVRATKVGGSVVKPADFGKAGGKGGYQAQLSKQIKSQETFVKESNFTEEQKATYAESLEKRGRLGIRWLGTPRKRVKAAEKIGDLKAKRKNQTEVAAVQNRNAEKDRQINAIKSSPVYQQAKALVDQETRNLQAAERALASALEQGQAQNIIDGYRRDAEAANIKIKQAESDFSTLNKEVERLEKEKEKLPEYKRKKSTSETLDELLDEREKNKPKEPESAPTPSTGPKTP